MDKNKFLFPSIIWTDIERCPEYINEKLGCKIIHMEDLCVCACACACMRVCVRMCVCART